MAKTKPDGELRSVVITHVLLVKVDMMGPHIRYYQYPYIILDTMAG